MSGSTPPDRPASGVARDGSIGPGYAGGHPAQKQDGPRPARCPVQPAGGHDRTDLPMPIIATAPPPEATIANDRTAPRPGCPPWCVDHVEDADLLGDGIAWHRGRRYQSANAFTGHYERVDGKRRSEVEPVWLQAEACTPDAEGCDAPGVYVSQMGCKLSVEDAMSLAADLIRCAGELVSAEIAAIRGGTQGAPRKAPVRE